MENTDYVNDAITYILNNLKEDLSVDQIANAVGISKYHFSRIFHQETGFSVMEYVKKKRLSAAMKDIAAGEKILDVALLYGWQTHSGFIKAFEKEYDFSPSFLRAMLIAIEEFGGAGMEKIYYKREDAHLPKDILFEKLCEELDTRKLDEKKCDLESIYSFACECYSGLKRYSGDAYITHPINTAILLARMEAETDVIYAGLFVDVLKKTKISEEKIRKRVPEHIADLIVSVNEFDVNSECTETNEVILIKLAERLQNMRTLEFMDERKWHEKAVETCEIFLPLAKKIGNERVLTELSQLSMKYV